MSNAYCIIGPTGEYPQGKLRDDDNGALNIGVATVGKHIILNFATPTKWIGMDLNETKDFVGILQDHINNLSLR